MRKYRLPILVLLFTSHSVFAQSNSSFITSDIDNFWMAYDKIVATRDSATQYDLLNRFFIEKGTPGLQAMMQVRRYTPQSYIDAIHQYPLFWNSIRPNTLLASRYSGEIAANVAKLKKLYPALRPAKIYFTIGALRSGGTTLDSMILIGSEIAFANEKTVSSEFPSGFSNLQTYFKTNPINIIAFTNVHEYVHTQQKTTVGNSVLAQCVLEGAAELLAEKATGQASTLPALAYGRTHAERVREVFASQLFSPLTGLWLYNNTNNEFGIRDLGYYVGYAICEKYLEASNNISQAIREMIELDYNNDSALAVFVDKSGYLSKPVQLLQKEYEAQRPVVTAVRPAINHITNADTAIKEITVDFSAVMDKGHRNFELGPLGKDNLLMVKRFIAFSEDGRSASFEVELKPGKHYQLLLGDRFFSKDGSPLQPFLLDFSTK